MADDVTHANTMAVTTGWNARSADLDRFSISCQSNVLKAYNVQIEGLSFCNSYFVNEFKNLSLCGSVKFEEKRLNHVISSKLMCVYESFSNLIRGKVLRKTIFASVIGIRR